ncbi:MAG: 4'-phosphopantetheinyl transferase superfamily protein [Tannerellaceae bacterium]|jgi:3-oxoacyl-(acyl-carrier-protein) synthase/phosphopantetheinyl transferase (holo-ACP synthase)/malonyl CoA-acyl carrier protein transacylase|nr:4'-phosphopantetheinyl transferase superfamily protein [Tannerellaceae bacterium]
MTQNNHIDTDIAIVGMSCIFPGAQNIDQFWYNLKNGVDSIIEAPAERIDPMYFQKGEDAYDRFYCNRGGFLDIPMIDPMKYGFLPIAAKGMEPEQLFMMKLAFDALEDARVFEKNISLENGCVIIGKGNFGNLSSMRNMDIVNTSVQVVRVVKACIPGISDEDLKKIRKEYQAQKGEIKPDTAIALMPNLIAALVTNKLNMHGPAYTVDGACASSAIAINHASELLLSGQCDIALAAGMHTAQSAMFQASFNMLGAISHKGVISPFSEDADGLLPSEGGGVLVLKTLKKAIEDNDRIYALINASAVFSDGSGVSVMAPNTKGQQLTIAKAWEKVRMDPMRIGLIEAHGTATIAGDRVEINTLNEFFGKDASLNKIWLGSVKSNIGHTMPAAGMAGVMKVALALFHRQIPPTLHAERPAKALIDSRFELPQTAIDWDGDKYPLIAGVNAFGFGGINSHVIMTAYDNKPENLVPDNRMVIRRSFKQAYLIAADTKEELLAKIDKKHWLGSKGKYKLVVFNPTDERIAKARSIVERNKPWKGRMDIWFSNEPLLEKDGKLAFLFSGFNMEMEVEVDTVADYFRLEHPYNMAEQGLLNHSLKLYQINNLLDTSLKKLEVIPDMNAGHSIGEWHAGKASGLVTDENVKAMMQAWVKDLDMEIDESSQDPNNDYDSKLEDVYFVAVGCGYKELEPIIKDIPELYLSNDNCNTQVLMCGKREAIDEMCERLRKNQIFNQELPYKSGYHTPFIAKYVGILDYCLNQIKELKEPTIPVWSATSLEQYPTEMSEYRKLTFEHITSHIRFRELVYKLYTQEKARVFIQIGAGPLTGFVEDILQGENFSVISTHNPGRSGIEQLRRILALLYIEGKGVDTLFIRIGEISKVKGQELEIEGFNPFVSEFPLVKEILKKQNRFDVSFHEESVNSDQPLGQKVDENIRVMSLVQKEMMDIMNEVKSLEQKFNFTSKTTHPSKEKIPPIQKNRSETIKKAFNEEIVITIPEYPYITDHTVVKQPAYWSVVEDFDVVIPMTMSIELIMEIAEKHASSKMVLGLSSFSIFQWMNVFHEFRLKTEGKWISDNLMKLEMKDFISTEIMLGDKYPVPPQKYAGEINLGKKTHEPPTFQFIYKEIMFHGPNYQGIIEITSINEHGMNAVVKAAGGKGSLLDTLGQLIGVYLRTIVKENNVCFPVNVGKITFYQDFHDQEGVFDFTLVVTEITDDFINGDMILKRNAQVWCIAENWLNRRFEMDGALWNIINVPLENQLAKPLEETPVVYFDLAYSKTGSWPFIEKRYLNKEEKVHVKGLLLNKRRPYIISRIAIKDAIRAYMKEKYGKKSYPIEISIEHDENGKPLAKGLEEVNGLEISLSHKGNESVALVSEKPVGVDIEQIENRSPDFMNLSFTEGELELLKDREQAEWSTRFWTAKEAYGKMLGVGLEGNPKKYEIEKVEDESLFIGEQKINTIRHKEKYIVAWTQQI